MKMNKQIAELNNIKIKRPVRDYKRESVFRKAREVIEANLEPLKTSISDDETFSGFDIEFYSQTLYINKGHRQEIKISFTIDLEKNLVDQINNIKKKLKEINVLCNNSYKKYGN